jgi:hypothetical protein
MTADHSSEVDPRMKLHIITIDSANEPHAIRAAAEVWNIAVTVTWVGNSGQIVDYFAGQPAHDLIIISGHGNEHGLILPQLAEAIADRYPYHDVIRAEDFAQFVRLNGNTVINLACLGGQSSLAEAFLKQGARYYIGPIDYPDANAALMYILTFLYHHGVHQGDVVEAHHLAANHEDDRQQFKLYSSEG